MTTQTLIKMALSKIGKANPSPDNYAQALSSLNMLLDSFAYWDTAAQPIYEVTDINAELNLPPYYQEIFVYMLAAEEAPAYGIPQTEIAYLEAKAKALTNKLVYRRQTDDIPDMTPTTFIV